MNGLLLPTGRTAPVKGDVAVGDDPVQPLSASPTRRGMNDQGLASSVRTAGQPKLSSSPPFPSRAGPGLRSAASLAFIPRTSRTSAGIRKPLARCSEFELADMLDRNERILSTPLPSISPQEATTSTLHVQLQAQTRARERLRKETDDIRKELLTKRGIRQIQSDMVRWKVDDSVDLQAVNSKGGLAEAMNRLTVDGHSAAQAERHRLDPGAQDSLAWARDTLGVKKRLAEETQVLIPGSKVQQMSYEQSLALQSAALVAEMERDRRADEARPNNFRERSGNSMPSGTAHRLGRKSVSSSSTALRKGSSGSPILPMGGGRFGPCPGFGLPRRPSGGAGLVFSPPADTQLSAEDGAAFVKTDEAVDAGEVDEGDGEGATDAEERRRTVSPSDLFDYDSGEQDDGEDTLFEDDYES